MQMNYHRHHAVSHSNEQSECSLLHSQRYLGYRPRHTHAVAMVGVSSSAVGKASAQVHF